MTRRAAAIAARAPGWVHAVPAAVPLDADAPSVERLARAQGRLVGAGTAEIEAAAVSVLAALRHPVFERARAASEIRREAPVTLSLPPASGDVGAAFVEGVLDLAFREVVGGEPVWTVVDYKTDRELSGRRAEYEARVSLYAAAVRAATGEDARAVLLSV